MNIYLLNATETAYLPAHLLVQQMPIKGLIGLENNAQNASVNEYYDYSSFCTQHNIEHITLSTYNLSAQEDKEKLLNCDIDIILSISWQRLLPQWLIQHCRIGVVGSHGSPLGISQGRGRSPQNWALMLGCPTFSYSIFWIDPGVDSGAVIDTREFSYTETDDIMTSYIKSGLVMADMMVNSYHNGNLEKRYGTPQTDENAYYLPQRTPDDGLIDWKRPARDIYDFVRSLTHPYPGAFTKHGDDTIAVWQGRYIDGENINFNHTKPGEVLLVYPNGELLVQCRDSLFLITDYSPVKNNIRAGHCFHSANFTEQIKTIVERHQAKYDYPISPLITNYFTQRNKGG